MSRLLKYIFWKLRYLFSGPDNDLAACMNRLDRTKWPWRKFRPGAWHNDDGYNWEVWLDDEQSYTASNVPLVVDVQYGMETGKVVGVKIRDCVLRKAAEIEEAQIEEAQTRAQQSTKS